MNFLVFQVLYNYNYLDNNNFIFYSLVCKDWNKIIEIIKKDSNYQTPYSVLISESLLQYAEEYMKLVYCDNVKHAIIKNNDLKTIQYLSGKTNILDWHGSYNYANLDTMKWLKENGCNFCYDTFRYAVSNGNLDIMKWLKENGCKSGSLTFNYNGNTLKKKNSHLKFQKYFEYQYSKKDLINYLKIKDKSKILTSPQFWSGSFFLKKNKMNKNLLVNWIKIMKKNKLIDASISKKKENKKFIESRWDQSVFSILAKIFLLKKLSASECEWAENGNSRVWTHLKKYPILAKRDLKRNLMLRFFNRQKRTYNRYKHRIKKWRDG